MDTAQVSEPLFGDKLYQKRAQLALPLLVRQAIAEKTITYQDLAQELEMPNPRNLNYVLGSIGQTLNNLAVLWHTEIPPLQCLVINKQTGLPGEGIGWFITDLADYKKLSNAQRKNIVDAALQKIFAFSRWEEVLHTLGLKPAPNDFVHFNAIATHYGGGEGTEHKHLKEFIAANPSKIGLPLSLKSGDLEHPLPSGDVLDIFFANRTEHIGVEVKSHISTIPDIVRGFYQCIKYQAVLEARLAATGQPQNVRTILVLGGALPKELIPLKNILGIDVIDQFESTQ